MKSEYMKEHQIVNKEGIETCYLIDFYNNTKEIKDSFSLRKAVHYTCN